MFVLRKVHGKRNFVAISGRANSYTSKLRWAKRFTTYEEAERNRCGNEVVCTLHECIELEVGSLC